MIKLRRTKNVPPAWEWLLVLGLCSVPLLAGRFLPSVDIPQHLAMAKAVVSLLGGDLHFGKYYLLDPWPQPYWLYYTLVGMLSTCMSIEIANKLVIFAYSVGIPFGVRSLLLAFGRDAGWWLLAIPLAWSTIFFYGFMAYLVGVPLVLFGIATLERCCNPGTPPRNAQWQLGILSCLIYLAHAQAYLWFGLAAAVLISLHWKGATWCARRIAPLTPSLVLFGAWVWKTFVSAKPATTAPPTANYGTLWELGMRWEPSTRRVAGAMEQLFGACTDGSNLWLGWIWTAALGLGVALALRQRWHQPNNASGRRRYEYRVEILMLAFICTWLVLPYDLNGQWYLAPRYLIFSAAIGIVAAAGSSTWHRRIVWFGIAVSCIFSLNVGRVVRDFQPAMAGLEVVLKSVPPGERIGQLPFDERNTLGPDGNATNGVYAVIDLPTSVSAHGYAPQFPGAPEGWLSPTHHASAYYQVWSAGDIGVSFAAAPTNPVRYRPGQQPRGLDEFVPESIDWDIAREHFGWFLVRGPLQGKGVRLGEFADQVMKSGGWELWRTKPR